jgi:glycine cleavage system H protein
MSMQTYRGFEVRTDRYYHHDTNLWVLPIDEHRVRVGLDSLGLEINGTLAQLTLLDPPQTVAEGDAIGSLEAEKYVGALTSPIAGVVVAVNQEVLANVSALYAGCYDTWIVELEIAPSALRCLVAPDDAFEDFTKRVETFRAAGVLAW